MKHQSCINQNLSMASARDDPDHLANELGADSDDAIVGESKVSPIDIQRDVERDTSIPTFIY